MKLNTSYRNASRFGQLASCIDAVVGILRTNMSVSILDSRVFRDLFGTKEIRDVFSDEAFVRCMIETEAALARAQAKCNVIPHEAAHTITESSNAIEIE